MKAGSRSPGTNNATFRAGESLFSSHYTTRCLLIGSSKNLLHARNETGNQKELAPQVNSKKDVQQQQALRIWMKG